MTSQAIRILYLSSLKDSYARLTEQMQENKTEQNKLAIVRAFDFCYKLSWKAMQEFLDNAGIEIKFPNEVFEESMKIGIIKDINLWFNFLEKRNSIIYAYNAQVLKEIMSVIPKFEDEVGILIKLLEEKMRQKR